MPDQYDAQATEGKVADALGSTTAFTVLRTSTRAPSSIS